MSTNLTKIIEHKIKQLEDGLELLEKEKETVTSKHTFDSDIKHFYHYQKVIAINQERIKLLREILKILDLDFFIVKSTVAK